MVAVRVVFPATVASIAISPFEAVATKFPVATISRVLTFSANIFGDVAPMLPVAAVSVMLIPRTSKSSIGESLSDMSLPETCTLAFVLSRRLMATIPVAV